MEMNNTSFRWSDLWEEREPSEAQQSDTHQRDGTGLNAISRVTSERLDRPFSVHTTSDPDSNREATVQISESTEFFLPEFDPASIRQATRAIRAQVPQKEYESMLQARNRLVIKEFDEGLTHKEQVRLQMLRWQIEGIEDARIGPELDQLEAHAKMQEQLAKMIHDFKGQVQTVISRESRRPNRRHQQY